MIYIAGPYYHSDPAVIEKRMEVVYAVMFRLVKEGHHPVSPMLMHSVVIRHPLPNNFEFWGEYSLKMLSQCSAMLVIMSDGWEESLGLKQEILFCNEQCILVEYLDPKEFK